MPEKNITLTEEDVDRLEQTTLSLVRDERKKRSELTLEGVDIEDIKDWWVRGVLNNTAYIAIALKCEALRTYRVSGKMPSEVEIDFEGFADRWKHEDAVGRFHELSTGEIMSAIAALQKKYEFTVRTRQLTLDL
ncbi:MAG: hypothetical protein F6K42_12615 [Leptolyngbya sp. SIO1D8]|nr:hypothetical protein [Leptolyngbya sp. SIO1D8]